MSFDSILADLRRDQEKLAGYLKQQAGTSEEVKALAMDELYSLPSDSILSYEKDYEQAEAKVKAAYKSLQNTIVSGVNTVVDALDGSGAPGPFDQPRVFSRNKPLYTKENSAALSGFAYNMAQIPVEIRFAFHNFQHAVSNAKEAISTASKSIDPTVRASVEQLDQLLARHGANDITKLMPAIEVTIPDASGQYVSSNLFDAVKNLESFELKSNDDALRVYPPIFTALADYIGNAAEAYDVYIAMARPKQETRVMMAKSMLNALVNVKNMAAVFFENRVDDASNRLLIGSVEDRSFDNYKEARGYLKDQISQFKENLTASTVSRALLGTEAPAVESLVTVRPAPDLP